MLFIIAAALSYFVAGIARGKSNLVANAPTGLLVLLFQWPLIVAHELGHGLFARAFGYGPVRLFIGFGKTLFHFTFLGFTWIINLIPFGGLAYAIPKERVIRWQWILFISGGLLVNSALLALAWIFLRADIQLFPQNVLLALVFANALVIAENILPYTAQTHFGPLDTDGKLLYHALFYWNKPPSKARSKATILALRVLRLVGVATLLCCAVAFFLLAGFLYFAKFLQDDSVVRISLTVFFALLGSLLLWYSWRFLKEPILTSTPPAQNPFYTGFAELRSTSTTNSDDLATIQTHFLAGDYHSALQITADLLAQNPKDLLLIWSQADLHLAADEPSAAEASCNLLLAQIAARNPSHSNEPDIYFTAAAKRLHAIMLQNDGRFGTECTAVLQTLVTATTKITLLDQLACVPLIHEKPELYSLAEFCARKALEIAPGTPTLQGTLGALLAERSDFASAEPLLRACHQSPAANDRGITSYYLALLAENSGDLNTARKLAKDSIALHPGPWLVKKANTLLNRLRQT